MENNLEYVFDNRCINIQKESQKIYNKFESEEKIKEKINVESLPLCIECIIEDEDGEYICLECRINLCPQHAKEHLDKFQHHKFSYLMKK